jgi:hypothetical protein
LNNKNHKNNYRPRRRRKNHSRPNNNSNQGTSIEKLQKKYLLLVEALTQKRAKYFDEFHHHDPNRVAKLRKTFEKASKELFDFEQSLSPDQKTTLLHENSLDQTYSTTNKESALGEQVPSDIKPLNPHLLKTQTEANFSDDTEESVGTMEDYRSYKGE